MRWYLRFNLAWTLCGGVINFLLLSANLAPTLGRYLDCRALWPALALPPCVFGALLLLGWALDRWGWYQRQDGFSRTRSPTWDEVFRRLDQIEETLKEMKDAKKTV